jgi:DNA-binding response OmpR family regulator
VIIFASSETPDSVRSPRSGAIRHSMEQMERSDQNLVVRLALVGESSASALLIWSELLHRDIDICRVSENYLADISPNRFDYDVLIIAGNDPKRVKRLLRFYAAAITNKTKVALVRSTGPKERATLLRAGFDDVFDPRMTIPEAQARMRAHHARHCLTRAHPVESKAEKAEPWDEPDEHFALPPTSREKAMFEILHAADGSVVSMRRLAQALGPDNALKPASVKVLISTLRKKLRAGLDIRSDRQNGYALQDIGARDLR